MALPRARPGAYERLVAAGEPNERSKLGRAPTLVVASAKLTGDDHQNHEDVLATAVAVYIVLLAAHARGLASYWRTPKLLQSPEGRAAVGLEDDEQFVALIHLGYPVTQPAAKPRRPVDEYVSSWPEREAVAPDMAGAAHQPLRSHPISESSCLRAKPEDRFGAEMRARGLEPPRAEAHRDLNPARLPVPPRPR